MKIKITDGPKPWKGDRIENKNNASKYSSEEWKAFLTDMDYKGKFDNASVQKFLAEDPRTKPYVDAAHEKYGMPKNGKFDSKLGYRWDPAIDNYLNKNMLGKPDIEADPEPINNNLYTKDEQKEYLYEAAKSKNPYQKRNLPFYQAAPELAGYVNALNSYGYYTPDFTHQELNAPTLNIQPQLQSIDSSLNAVNDMTTGNPALDNARRSMAFTQALNAKQQAFANKQNYDAEGRYKADVYNNTARNQEQNLDVEATNTVHNTYRAEAKDLAEQERMNSINSLVEKQAKHNANETKKKLWLDNFYQNVEFDEDGNLKIKGNEMKFDRNPYGNIETDEPEYTTSGAPKIYPTGSDSNTGVYGFDIEDPKPIVPEIPKLIERSKTGIPLLPSTPLKRLKPGEDREDLIPTPNTNIPFLQPGNKIPLDFSKPITKLSKGGKYRLPL